MIENRYICRKKTMRELTEAEKEYIRFNSNVEENCDNYSVHVFGNYYLEGREAYDKFYDEVEVGDELSIDPRLLKAHTVGELEDASDGTGVTSTPIEIAKCDGYFVVYDGHHRLYEALRRGKKTVDCVVVGDGDANGIDYLRYKDRKYNGYDDI